MTYIISLLPFKMIEPLIVCVTLCLRNVIIWEKCCDCPSNHH